MGFLGLRDSLLYGLHESPVEHMESIGWVRAVNGAAKLTDLGQALLRAADTEDQSQSQVVVLDNENPLAYASLVAELSDVGDALLIDPYLDVEHLIDLEKYTGINRTLISARHSESKRGTRIKMLQEKRSDDGIEVRVADELHDRIVVSEDGKVWTLGMSLNGVTQQKSITVLTPLPDRAAEVLAD